MAAGLIVPAAGSGERLGAGRPKALVHLAGQPLLIRAVRSALESGVIEAVVVAAPDGLVDEVDRLLQREIPVGVSLRTVPGGTSRQASVQAAIAALPDDVDVVLVHDAARCLTPPGLFARVAAGVEAGDGAVVPGIAVVDTLKEIDSAAAVVATPDRALLRAVQTPQGFRRRVLEEAHRSAVVRGDGDVTDDAGLVERMGGTVRVVPGEEEAFKVTRPFDLVVAEAVLAAKSSYAGASDESSIRDGREFP